MLDAAHLFEGHTTWIGFRRSALLRAYMYEFIELLAPHLPRKLVRETEKAETQEEVDRVLGGLTISAARQSVSARRATGRLSGAGRA